MYTVYLIYRIYYAEISIFERYFLQKFSIAYNFKQRFPSFLVFKEFVLTLTLTNSKGGAYLTNEIQNLILKLFCFNFGRTSA